MAHFSQFWFYAEKHKCLQFLYLAICQSQVTKLAVYPKCWDEMAVKCALFSEIRIFDFRNEILTAKLVKVSIFKQIGRTNEELQN